jgi:hypothetical protein
LFSSFIKKQKALILLDFIMKYFFTDNCCLVTLHPKLKKEKNISRTIAEMIFHMKTIKPIPFNKYFNSLNIMKLVNVLLEAGKYFYLIIFRVMQYMFQKKNIFL